MLRLIHQTSLSRVVLLRSRMPSVFIHMHVPLPASSRVVILVFSHRSRRRLRHDVLALLFRLCGQSGVAYAATSRDFGGFAGGAFADDFAIGITERILDMS